MSVTIKGSGLVVANNADLTSTEKPESVVLDGFGVTALSSGGTNTATPFQDATAPALASTKFSYTGDPKVTMWTKQVSVSTTDATVTTLYSWTLTDLCSTTVDVVVTVQLSDSTKSNEHRLVAKILRKAASVTVVVSSDQSPIAKDDATLSSVTIDNSTTTARLRITGKAATNLTWGCRIIAQEQLV